ncbi:MAG TPA: histidine phosphatase family protein [Quisquiliibacterium sp.]|nr:histidine phosphatase family protein [Quisquiliibacterium sp.]
MSIILVRHGETALNAARVLQPPETPLSERGLGQAEAVAKRIAGLAPAAILSSDLARAAQTAAAVAAATGRPVDLTPLLHERNFGELRGLAYDSLGHDPIHDEAAPPGGESMEQFRRRVEEAFAHMLDVRASLAGPLVVVSHGLVIRTLIERHLRLPPGTAAPERLANTSVTIFSPESPYQVSVVNCALHLEGDLSDDARSLAGV